MTTEVTYGAAAVSNQLRLDGAPGLSTIEFGSDGGYVGDGGSGARVMTAPDGVSWIIKSHFLGGQAHRYLCLNEAVSAQVALRIGVKVPTPAVLELSAEQLASFSSTATSADRFVFASEYLTHAETLSPSAAAEGDKSQLTGIAVLDCLICNTDRKPEHILTARRDDDYWEFWAIDHGHCFAVSDTLTGLSATQASPAPIPMVQPYLTEELAEPFLKAAEAIPRGEFAAMAAGLPAPWVIEPDAPETIADVLFARARHLRTMFGQHV
jgi:hypothetical protein